MTAAGVPLHRRRTDCRLCGCRGLELALPLAPQAVLTPDTLPDPAAGDPALLARLAAPIDLMRCPDCGHLQQASVFSSRLHWPGAVIQRATPNGVRAALEELAGLLTSRFGPASARLALDLSSFDGTLLRALAGRGWRPLGVEPIRSVAAAAEQAGIPTLPVFFTVAAAGEIRRRHGPAGLVTAITLSVGPHWEHPANIDDFDEFTAALNEILADDGVFVLETQYGAETVRRRLLDTVHHDHLSYFLAAPLVARFARDGLETIGLEAIAAKGGSLRLAVRKAGGRGRPDPSVTALLAEEAGAGCLKPAFFRGCADALGALRRELHRLLETRRACGPVIGFGVSVGTAALLAQLELAGRIDFLVDDAPNKGDRLIGPGYDLPIRPSSALYRDRPGTVVLFAWRFADAILDRHRAFLRAGGVFVAPLPEVRLIRDDAGAGGGERA